MLRNTANQYFYYRAADISGEVLNDEANHTLTLSIDNQARVALTNSPTVESGNLYKVLLTQAETDGHQLSFYGTSVGGVELFGEPSFVIYTERSGDSCGTGSVEFTEQLVDDSMNPIPNAKVTVYLQGSSTIAAVAYTNSNGYFTVYLDPETYDLSRTQSSYTFDDNPVQIEVTA